MDVRMPWSLSTKLYFGKESHQNNKPRGRPETLVVNEELKVIVEADPSQTTSELAAGFGFHSAVFSHLLHNNNLLEALEDIMGTPDILLHHTKAHNKPPGKGAPYLMHQDYHYFPFKNDSMVAAFLSLDKSSSENGGLCVYPGSHKLGPLKDFGAIEKGEAFHWADMKKYPIDRATPVETERGDIVVFSYLLLHGSYMNLSEKPRRMFLIQLMAADDEPLEEVHKSLGQGWVLRGKNDNRKAVMAENYLH